jgi:hypothetical protein
MQRAISPRKAAPGSNAAFDVHEAERYRAVHSQAFGSDPTNKLD